MRNISEDFLIQRVSFRMVSQSVGVYQVELATLRTITLIDFLISQLRVNGTIINDEDNTVIQKYLQAPETIIITDELIVSNSHNPQLETVTIADSVTTQSLNYAVEFVVGEYAPSGVKRQFVLDGSILS